MSEKLSKKSNDITNNIASTTARPVNSFPMEFKWHTGLLELLFNDQIIMLQDAVVNAIYDDRSVVYLSCPISERGGGFADTNIEIARFTERRLMNDFGDRVWILNPAAYQLESKSGRGNFQRHAEKRNISKKDLKKLPQPKGGDYMRMWTKVLVEDDSGNLGNRFAAYYFLGPSDVAAYFATFGGGSLSSQIENYLSSKLATDMDFQKHFAMNKVCYGFSEPAESQKQKGQSYEDKVKAFIRFYALRASAAFSKGCHDEWNIFRLLNRARIKQQPDVGELLAAYFDGRQITPGSAVQMILPGYEVRQAT